MCLGPAFQPPEASHPGEDGAQLTGRGRECLPQEGGQSCQKAAAGPQPSKGKTSSRPHGTGWRENERSGGEGHTMGVAGEASGGCGAGQAPGEWAGKPGPWQSGSQTCVLPEPGIVRDGTPCPAFFRPAPSRSEPILNPPQAYLPFRSSSEATCSGRLAQHTTRLTGHSLGLPRGPAGGLFASSRPGIPWGPHRYPRLPPSPEGVLPGKDTAFRAPGPSWAWSVPTRSSPSLF